LGVPANGLRNEQLAQAKGTSPEVWLNYANVNGSWTPMP
jgi:hypothetical protein